MSTKIPTAVLLTALCVMGCEALVDTTKGTTEGTVEDAGKPRNCSDICNSIAKLAVEEYALTEAVRHTKSKNAEIVAKNAAATAELQRLVCVAKKREIPLPAWADKYRKNCED